MYKPPFTITDFILQKAISISEKIGKISSLPFTEKMPILHRNNHIESIHSSLVIEANSLSLNQVRDIINGKWVLGPQKEIQEVKNAYEAYEKMTEVDAFSQNDLLSAHKTMMKYLDDTPGFYRNHGEGVFDGDKLIFMAPPPNRVPDLMDELFQWLQEDHDTPILVKSCVFHYEFVFIHPFGDGNGRMARLWQNVLLIRWNLVFEYLPLESQIKRYQEEYYQAIAKCNVAGNSTAFVEFMLRMIDETLEDFLSKTGQESISFNDTLNRLLMVMEEGVPLSANEIMKKLRIKSKETLRKTYLNPALENGLIKMTLPDKPHSKNQKYFK